jgi:hypothetical protein
MAEHTAGNQVVLCGTIVEIEGGVALVRVDRSFPAGGTIAVRLGMLPAAGESDEDLIRRAMVQAGKRPGRLVTAGGGKDG